MIQILYIKDLVEVYMQCLVSLKHWFEGFTNYVFPKGKFFYYLVIQGDLLVSMQKSMLEYCKVLVFQ